MKSLQEVFFCRKCGAKCEYTQERVEGQSYSGLPTVVGKTVCPNREGVGDGHEESFFAYDILEPRG